MALKVGVGTSSAESESADIMAEINITPLTDVFLVLLIIFMVTSSVMSQMGVDVNLPQASPQTSSAQPDGVIVSLLPDGSVRVNQERIPQGNWGEMESKLKAAFSRTTSRLVVLEGDRKAFLGNAIEVMDHARAAGASNFAIATSLNANP